MAYRSTACTDVDSCTEMMDEFRQGLKSTPPAPGQDRVLVPGQPEWEMEEERRAKGIPLHTEVVDWLRGLCDDLHVTFDGLDSPLYETRADARLGDRVHFAGSEHAVAAEGITPWLLKAWTQLHPETEGSIEPA